MYVRRKYTRILYYTSVQVKRVMDVALYLTILLKVKKHSVEFTW